MLGKSKQKQGGEKPSFYSEVFFFPIQQTKDKAGVSLHNGLWAPLFGLGAGTSM